MSEYVAGKSALEDWRREYKWTRAAVHPSPEEIAAGKSDFKKTWRMFCKMDRREAWLERRAIRAEARAAQLQTERDALSESLKLCVATLKEYADADRSAQMEGAGTFSNPDEFIERAVQQAQAALEKLGRKA